MKADELIAASVAAFAERYQRTGHVPPGTNGPRAHVMTPLRNAAHWLYACCEVYEWSPSPMLLQVAHRLRDLLLAPEGRPAGFTHQFRIPTSSRMDGTCGVVGPAWAMEALAKAASTLDDERCLDLAEALFFAHPFSERHALWHVRDPDGTVRPIDGTLDHQLWFAGCAAGVKHHRRAEIEERLRAFTNGLNTNMRLAENGRIRFLVPELRPQWRVVLSQVKQTARTLRGHSSPEARHPPEILEAGYQAFSTHALGLLRAGLPEHAFFGSMTIKAATSYLHTLEYRRLLDGENPFGYAYNPPGFEVPFSLWALTSLDDEQLVSLCEDWILDQVQRTFDWKTFTFSRNTADRETLSARIYESTRLPQRVLSQVEVGAP